MGILDFLKRTDINAGIEKFRNTKNAVLLDVRTPEEVKEERIAGSVNIPLDQLQTAAVKFPDKNTPLFVYCYSGSRSEQAIAALRRIGFTNTVNIGGINSYTGQKERG